jgi:hypothetical protein
MKHPRIALLVGLGLILLGLGAPPLASAQTPLVVRRVAVIVGSDGAPPGRQPLRYAHEDARRMADVMQRLGRFAPADVQVLLDPHPADLARAFDAAAQALQPATGTETMFVFYFSGHSDGGAIYPNGEIMPIAEVRDRLARVGARIRVGILDTCRGGSWTRAKGVTVGPPLAPADLVALGGEGVALISSSSGLENAHEADSAKGSFFTHHLVAGLLGAADRSGDGSVTLQEAFDYAKERTVRDSARFGATPQHPSFDVQLRGRQDIVLTQLASSTSALELIQTRGPLEVIHLASGVTVVEMSIGERRARIALLPGKYLVRRVDGGRTFTREVTIAPGQSVTLAEGELEATGAALALKGDDPTEPLPRSEATTLPRKYFEIRLALGASVGPSTAYGSSLYDPGATADRPLERSFAATGAVTYGLTDRLQWAMPLPAFAYRFGDPGGVEIVPRAGLTSLGYSPVEGLIGSFDAGVGVRVWTAPRQSFIASLAGTSRFSARTSDTQLPSRPPSAWSVTPIMGYTLTLGNVVSFHPGLGASFPIGFEGVEPSRTEQTSASLLLGAVLSLGYRQLPLVQVHLSQGFALDAHATWSIDLRTGDVRDRYLAGFTWSF